MSLVVDPVLLRQQAARVLDVAEGVEQQRTPVAGAVLDHTSFGRLNSGLAAGFDRLRDDAVDAVSRRATLLREAADALQLVADEFERVDRLVAALFAGDGS